MAENKSKLSIVTNGIIKENPVLRLVLGTCPTHWPLPLPFLTHWAWALHLLWC